MVSKYTVTGMLVAALLFNIVPQSFIQDYLGNPGYCVPIWDYDRGGSDVCVRSSIFPLLLHWLPAVRPRELQLHF